MRMVIIWMNPLQVKPRFIHIIFIPNRCGQHLYFIGVQWGQLQCKRWQEHGRHFRVLDRVAVVISLIALCWLIWANLMVGNSVAALCIVRETLVSSNLGSGVVSNNYHAPPTPPPQHSSQSAFPARGTKLTSGRVLDHEGTSHYHKGILDLRSPLLHSSFPHESCVWNIEVNQTFVKMLRIP